MRVILDKEQQRALMYVGAANTGGYRPTEAEVDEWRLRPGPLPGKRGRLIAQGQPGTPAPWMASLGGSAMSTVMQQLSSAGYGNANVLTGLHTLRAVLRNSEMFGTPGTPARYAPDGPPESFLINMRRLGWLSEDDGGGLSLTPLSRALLRAEEAQSEGTLEVLLLKEGDPLAYGTLLGHIAECGDAMIVDPYLRSEQLLSLLSQTSASRFLIGSSVSKGEVVAMVTLLSAAGWPAHPELRRAGGGKLHDRLIVTETSVQTLGTSINAVGRNNTTVLMAVPTSSADHLRGMIESVWAEAEVLATSSDSEGLEPPSQSVSGGEVSEPVKPTEAAETIERPQPKRSTGAAKVAKPRKGVTGGAAKPEASAPRSRKRAPDS